MLFSMLSQRAEKGLEVFLEVVFRKVEPKRETLSLVHVSDLIS